VRFARRDYPCRVANRLGGLKDGGTGAVTGCITPGRHPELGSGTGTAFQLVSLLELAALPTAIACARLHAVNVLHEWGLRDLADDAAVLISELMTNALNASAALAGRPPIALGLAADSERLVIEAWDRSPMDPDPSGAGSDQEHGRGLVIVTALSNRWGSEHVAPDLKVVWAQMEIPGPP
jgi:anti-sigma regulatory factor (Ser/Thr protein kinase)